MIVRRFSLSLPILVFALLRTCCALAETNGVLREVYYGLPGSSLPDLTNSTRFPDNPDETVIDGNFEAPSNFADYYGQRVRAWLLPPTTGQYVFWVASDDNSELYLSTNEDPTRKRRIAYESAWAGVREYNKTATAKSAPVTLTNGFRYYIEALQKEGSGGDNLAIAWQKPGDLPVVDGGAPIPGSCLLPYGLGPPLITAQPASTSAVEGTIASFSVVLRQKLGAQYQWFENGNAILGATNAAFAFGPVAISDHGKRLNCAITNSFGYVISASAVLSVVPDKTAPALLSAGALTDPTLLIVVFSEPLDESSATNPENYVLDQGADILAAELQPDRRTVLLTTSALERDLTYTLTVNGLKDRAAVPNVVATNSQVAFTLNTVPLDFSHTRRLVETIGPSSRRSGLVLSELMYHPTNRPDGRVLEYIELYNSNPFREEISGFRVSGEVEFAFPTNTFMEGRSYLVLAAVPSDIEAVYGITNVAGGYAGRLGNKSGKLRLCSRQGAILFEVNYASDGAWPAAADGAGHSLVLSRPSLGETDPEAWSQSAYVGGSPGRVEIDGANLYCGVVINEIMAKPGSGNTDFIELYNYNSSSVDLSGSILTDDPAEPRFAVPAGTTLPPMSFLAFDAGQLGFGFRATGDTVLLIEPTGARVIDSVRFRPQQAGLSWGRYPDGAPELGILSQSTAGAANSGRWSSPVVINELMYAPISRLDEDQYIELFNTSNQAMNLGGWQIGGGLQYSVPSGVSLPAGGYLVIAAKPAKLLARYPKLTPENTLGPFAGALARSGETVTLSMPQSNATAAQCVVDEVRYDTGGRWGRWARSGGSSLELRDPRSNHRLPENWGDSDESAKSGWTTIEYTGVLDNGVSGFPADSLQIILLGPGECLVDDVEVLSSGTTLNLVPEASFDAGPGTWVAQGNHEQSSWQPQGGLGDTGCLHLRASDRGDTGANRTRISLKSTIASGKTATLRAKVRWLAGCPEILLRLRGNWLEASGNVLTTQSFGTPGAPNSIAVRNTGPAVFQVKHFPPVPGPNQVVTVTAHVEDPDGLAGLLLGYRLDPATNVTLVPMLNRGAGVFSAAIQGQKAGTLAAFHIEALDNASPRQTARYPSGASECLVRWGDPSQAGGFGTYRVWLTKATIDRWSKRERMSNQPLDCTFVYNGTRVIYGAGGQYSGSPWHSPNYDSPVGNGCDYVFTFPEDDPFLGETDATLQLPGNGGGDGTYLREQAAYWLAEQMGLPHCYRRSVNLFINGLRRAEVYEDAQQPNGDMTEEYYPEGENGDLHKIQVCYEYDDQLTSYGGVGATLQNVLTTGGIKKQAFYRWTFAKRAVNDSNNNFTNLFALVDTVNVSGLGPAYRQRLEAVLDVDNWLKTYAVEHAVGNNDSFAYGGGQNMYAYRPRDDTWKLLIWDIDFAFVSAEPSSDMFQGIGRSNGIDLSDPVYSRRYWEILFQLANGPLMASKANPPLDAKYAALIANGRSVENPASIKNYLAQRRSYLIGLFNTNFPAGFTVKSIQGSQSISNQNVVTLAGTAGPDLASLLINGVPQPLIWTSKANWNATVVLGTGTNLLSLSGLDWNGQPLAAAQTNISVVYSGTPEPAEQMLVFNEIMYHPATPGGAFIELYNAAGSTAFDLTGWRIAGLVEFEFAPGTIVKPGAYIVVAEDLSAFIKAYGASLPVVGQYRGSLNEDRGILRLLKPDLLSGQEVLVKELAYERRAPWPSAADGSGASLQLIDPSADNQCVGNWAAVSQIQPGITPQWKRVVAHGSASASTLYLYLQAAGDAYVDDFKLVAGSEPDAGPNLLANGGFEAALSGSWGIAPIYAASTASTTYAHSGTNCLHIVGSQAGASRASAIYQDVTPALTVDGTYTLSFWYLENPNGGALTVRLSGNGIATEVQLTPGGVQPRSRYTPGAQNSVRASLPPLPSLYLNEIGPGNLSGLQDRFGHSHPWLELYNAGIAPASLDGFYLSDNYTSLLQWPFPQGIQIPPGGFFTLFLDGNSSESTPAELHAPISALAQTGAVCLARSNGTSQLLLDYLNYVVPGHNLSFGRIPDGASILSRPFFHATPGASNDPALPPVKVLINEWMADNQTTLWNAANQAFDDWFELYNPEPVDADLSGYFLGASLSNRTQCQIPDGSVVPARGFLLVWADGTSEASRSAEGQLHVNFKLSKAGEAIGLFGPTGEIIDYVSFGPQAADFSEGRSPDGSDRLGALTSPTPGQLNGPAIHVPSVQLIQMSGSQIFRVTASAVPGRSYSLEHTASLAPANWQTPTPPVTATTSTVVLEDAGGRSQGFYRVKEVPQ